mmetsp:Transcript_33875/g.43290  ORF Transcript_33875/g.43290 Transcript_33875/m.43290 type:complete len:93 (-) Transcript_33875:119-397(-)
MCPVNIAAFKSTGTFEGKSSSSGWDNSSRDGGGKKILLFSSKAGSGSKFSAVKKFDRRVKARDQYAAITEQWTLSDPYWACKLFGASSLEAK